MDSMNYSFGFEPFVLCKLLPRLMVFIASDKLLAMAMILVTVGFVFLPFSEALQPFLMHFSRLEIANFISRNFRIATLFMLIDIV